MSEQLPRVFSELDLEVESGTDPETARAGGKWQAVILDLDLFESDERAAGSLQALPIPKQTIVLVPTRLRHLEAPARLRGALVLHKPSTVGEIGLGLRIVLKR